MICATESACLDTSMIHTDIVTDSQSVANVTCFRETHDLSTWGHEVANYELVESLNKSWKKGCFRIRKNKSRQPLDAAGDLLGERWVMGNMVADTFANSQMSQAAS